MNRWQQGKQAQTLSETAEALANDLDQSLRQGFAQAHLTGHPDDDLFARMKDLEDARERHRKAQEATLSLSLEEQVFSDRPAPRPRGRAHSIALPKRKETK